MCGFRAAAFLLLRADISSQPGHFRAEPRYSPGIFLNTALGICYKPTSMGALAKPVSHPCPSAREAGGNPRVDGTVRLWARHWTCLALCLSLGQDKGTAARRRWAWRSEKSLLVSSGKVEF